MGGKIILEATKIAGICVPLCFVAAKCFSNKIDFYKVVAIPIVEEVIHRGIVHGGIEYAQKAMHSFKSKNKILTEADLKAQQIFRVRLASALFWLNTRI